jgi:alkanesulfonate monooxygenase SsuD/methylene tetrahydromethanopterin reductase-like flavin-dependent oxidoreductase (luciferase family)
VKAGVVVLPSERWREAAPIWQAMDEIGFATAWIYDHLTWRDMRDGPWFSALPTLAAAATITSRLRLGTMVLSANFRHPVTLAKEAMTIDDVSGGRLELGIGAGAGTFDAVALGQEPWSRGERTARFEEFVDHLDRLLAEPAIPVLDGRFYAARDARAIPGCSQRPRLPFAIAASGPRALRVVARHGQGWITLGHPVWPDDLTAAERERILRDQVHALDGALVAEGRDPASVRRIHLSAPNREFPWQSVEAWRDHVGRLGELGFDEAVIHYPHAGSPFVLGTPDRFLAVMAEALGA